MNWTERVFWMFVGAVALVAAMVLHDAWYWLF